MGKINGMQLYNTVYIVLLPIILITYYFVSQPQRAYLIHILSAVNLLLWINALFTIRLLLGLIQFFRQLSGNSAMPFNWHDLLQEPILRMMGSVLLPFLFLVPYLRKSGWFSILMLTYTIWNYVAYSSYNWLNTILHGAYIISMFSAVYAILWLLHKKPITKINY
jgi:hypothetical protein